MHNSLHVGILLCIAIICVAPALAQSPAEAGRDVYAEHCAACHGERLDATGAAPDLKQLGADQKPHFDEIVHNGKGQMPPWEGTISDDEIGRVWAYIRSRAEK